MVLFYVSDSKERDHMIPSMYSKMSFAALEEVLAGIKDEHNLTKGQLRFLAAYVRWQVYQSLILLTSILSLEDPKMERDCALELTIGFR